MSVKISKKTKTSYVLNLLNDTAKVAEVVDKMPPQPLDRPVLTWSVGDYLQAIDNTAAVVSELLSEPLAYVAFGRVRQFRDEMKRVAKVLSSYTVPMSEDERRAAEGVKFPSHTEQVLLTCVKFYHLHSLKEAEALPLTDYIVAYRDTMSNTLFQRKLNALQAAKFKKNGR